MMKIVYRILLASFILTLRLSVFGQVENENDLDFPRIFGHEINYNDTSVTLTNNIIVKHSVETCSVIAYKENGKIKWHSKLPLSSCNIIYFGLHPKTKIKNSDILIQLSDKTMKGINSKNGRMINITSEDLEAFRKSYEKKQ